MTTFINHFIVCNIFIAIFIGIILIFKSLLKKHLSSRLQYNLWFLVLVLLAIPFVPFQISNFTMLVLQLIPLNVSSVFTSDMLIKSIETTSQTTSMNWMNDFSISVNKSESSVFSYIFITIWGLGILAMIILTLKSKLQLYHIQQSSLPVQNKKVINLFEICKSKMKIKTNIHIYSCAYLKSPIMIGIFTPRIFMPIHLISDLNEKDMYYILLHELQHYKHFDSFVNYLINLSVIVYWFNPLVWYAIKEMRNDREIACDSSVLQMLSENDYEDYGKTLISFAEKISLSPFPFVSSMGGNIKQIKKRILNIADYQSLSLWQKMKGTFLYCLIAVLLLGLSPLLSTSASEAEYYHLNEGEKRIQYVDLSSYFGNYNGSFVLYSTATDTWQIYNKDYATMRVSPDSTYKIYDALIGLESGIITPEHSKMNWSGETYSFDAWNKNQDLNSAIQNSVNWYFQNIDRQAGMNTVKDYILKIGYGNQDISGNFPSYWLESSLKISPMEQVELLRKFYDNEFNFNPQNIDAVKSALRIYSSGNDTMYGKTGTGQVNNQNISGWFIGYVETAGNVYYFATNIQDNTNATGSNATKITTSILLDLDIWQ